MDVVRDCFADNSFHSRIDVLFGGVSAWLTFRHEKSVKNRQGAPIYHLEMVNEASRRFVSHTICDYNTDFNLKDDNYLA